MSGSENEQAVQPAGAGGVVAVYARISLDRHDGEGVARQLEDCRALAAERWPGRPTVEYVDNDVSAFRARRRPEFDRLVADLHAGTVAALAAYHSDRLYRRLSDLEELISAVQAAGAEVATVRAGDVDLATASGRMVARLLGAVARHESERIGERVARAKAQRAAQGRPAGGGLRPYGLTADRAELVANEAELLRQAAASILDGTTWNRVVDELNDRGHRTAGGREWTIGTLRRVLTSPHVAGLRSYHGEIVGPATWPAILERGDWERLRRAAAARRRGKSSPPRHVLTGLLTCGRCLPVERTMWATGLGGRPGQFVYRCPSAATTNGRGCGSSISGGPIDRLVALMVLEAVDEGRLADVAATRGRARQAAPDLADLEAELDRRAIIRAVISRIVVGPAQRRGRFPLVEGVGRIDVDRVDVTWRA